MGEPALLTLRFRLRDRHAADLCRKARAVNLVWNYCNETQQKAVRLGRPWLGRFALHRLTAGAGPEINLRADTTAAVCDQYDTSRRTKRRPWLRFRGKKSLGWIPFKRKQVRIVAPGRFQYHGATYETMHWRELPASLIVRAGSFSQDSAGHWYINAFVASPPLPLAPSVAVGIDLGLKDIAVLSTGEKIGNPRPFVRAQARLAVAQRAHKLRQVRRIAAKVAATRRDYLHKASAAITAANAIVVVGNVSSIQLTRTSMAKSVLDAGWATLRKQLSYKALRHGGKLIEANEYRTTRTCSACGSVPTSSPKGLSALGIREWTCSDCGTVHDRDVNAARNILRVGLHTLAEGAALSGAGNASMVSRG